MKPFKFKSILPVLAIMVALITSSFATQKKLPLSPKRYGDVNYMEWVGSTYAVLSADTLSFYADTANSYAADPLRLLFNLPVNRGEEQIYPGHQVFEKICSHYVGRGEADSTTTKYDMFYSTSKNGTFYRVSRTGATAYADSTLFEGVTLVGAFASFQASPGQFWLPKVRVSSATDTANLVSARFWGCND
jgi:hypothetical protein